MSVTSCSGCAVGAAPAPAPAPGVAFWGLTNDGAGVWPLHADSRIPTKNDNNIEKAIRLLFMVTSSDYYVKPALE